METITDTPTRASGIERFALLVPVLAMSLVPFLSGCSPAPQQREAGWIVFPYMDNSTGRAGFRRLEEACRALRLQERHNVALKFVRVEMADRASLAADLKRVVQEAPRAIVAPSFEVMQEAVGLTTSVPIVFVTHQDPVEPQVISSLAQPPANITGISFHMGVEEKMLELLREAAPGARRLGVIVDPSQALDPRLNALLRNAARSYSISWEVVALPSIESLPAALRGARDVEAWLVTKVASLDEHRSEFVSLIAATGRPVIYPSRYEVEAGGPLAYEAEFEDPAGAVARQLDRVLSGASPRDIPILRPKRYTMTLNISSARKSGMQVTPELISRADKVL